MKWIRINESSKVNESFGGAMDVALGIALYKCIVGCIGAGVGLAGISGFLIKKHFDKKNVSKIKDFFQNMFDGMSDDKKEELRDMSSSEFHELVKTALREASTSDDAKVAHNAKKLLEFWENTYGSAISDALDEVLGIKRGMYQNFRTR